MMQRCVSMSFMFYLSISLLLFLFVYILPMFFHPISLFTLGATRSRSRGAGSCLGAAAAPLGRRLAPADAAVAARPPGARRRRRRLPRRVARAATHRGRFACPVRLACPIWRRRRGGGGGAPCRKGDGGA